MLMVAPPGLDGALYALEGMVRSDPDDLSLHRAYADLLLRHPDPVAKDRSRLIEAQLKLDGGKAGEDERKKLERRVKKCVRDHAAVWLGPLAPYLVDGEGYRFEMTRGWLGKVVVPALDREFLRTLATAPEAGLLHTLIVESVAPGMLADLAELRGAAFLAHLRVFWLDPNAGPEGKEVVEALVAEMTGLRELFTPWHRR